MQSIENDPKYVQIASKFRSHNVSVLRLAVVWQRLVFDLTCVLLELSGFIDAEQGLWNVCRSVSLSRHLPAAFRYCGLAAGFVFCYSKNYFCQDRGKKNQYRPWKKGKDSRVHTSFYRFNIIFILFVASFLALFRPILDLNWVDNVIPSVLWRCWLGGRKGIRPVKNWVVRCWHGYLSGARCRLVYDATATHCLLLQ